MDSLEKDTERLIEIYEEFSNVMENNKLKNRLRIDFLDQFDRIESPNEVDFYTLGLFYYEDYDDNSTQQSLEKSIAKAIECFEESVSINPDYYMSTYYLGHSHLDLAEFNSAIQFYLKVNQEQLKQDFPIWRFVILYEFIGYCYWNINDKENAMKYFTLFHDEYMKIKDFQDLIVLGDKIEECLTDKNDLVKGMIEYYNLKNTSK